MAEILTTRQPNLVDRHVGNRTRLRRQLLNMTQQQLAEKLGLTFQQLQKYERGTNRISAGRLFDLSQALDVPVSWFFEGIAGSPIGNDNLPPEDIGAVLAQNPEVLDAARALMRIRSRHIRRQLVKTITALSDTDSDETTH